MELDADFGMDDSGGPYYDDESAERRPWKQADSGNTAATRTWKSWRSRPEDDVSKLTDKSWSSLQRHKSVEPSFEQKISKKNDQWQHYRDWLLRQGSKSVSTTLPENKDSTIYKSDNLSKEGRFSGKKITFPEEIKVQPRPHYQTWLTKQSVIPSKSIKTAEIDADDIKKHEIQQKTHKRYEEAFVDDSWSFSKHKPSENMWQHYQKWKQKDNLQTDIASSIPIENSDLFVFSKPPEDSFTSKSSPYSKKDAGVPTRSANEHSKEGLSGMDHMKISHNLDDKIACKTSSQESVKDSHDSSLDRLDTDPSSRGLVKGENYHWDESWNSRNLTRDFTPQSSFVPPQSVYQETETPPRSFASNNLELYSNFKPNTRFYDKPMHFSETNLNNECVEQTSHQKENKNKNKTLLKFPGVLRTKKTVEPLLKPKRDLLKSKSLQSHNSKVRAPSLVFEIGDYLSLKVVNQLETKGDCTIDVANPKEDFGKPLSDSFVGNGNSTEGTKPQNRLGSKGIGGDVTLQKEINQIKVDMYTDNKDGIKKGPIESDTNKPKRKYIRRKKINLVESKEQPSAQDNESLSNTVKPKRKYTRRKKALSDPGSSLKSDYLLSNLSIPLHDQILKNEPTVDLLSISEESKTESTNSIAQTVSQDGNSTNKSLHIHDKNESLSYDSPNKQIIAADLVKKELNSDLGEEHVDNEPLTLRLFSKLRNTSTPPNVSDTNRVHRKLPIFSNQDKSLSADVSKATPLKPHQELLSPRLSQRLTDTNMDQPNFSNFPGLDKIMLAARRNPTHMKPYKKLSSPLLYQSFKNTNSIKPKFPDFPSKDESVLLDKSKEIPLKPRQKPSNSLSSQKESRASMVQPKLLVVPDPGRRILADGSKAIPLKSHQKPSDLLLSQSFTGTNGVKAKLSTFHSQDKRILPDGNKAIPSRPNQTLTNQLSSQKKSGASIVEPKPIFFDQDKKILADGSKAINFNNSQNHYLHYQTFSNNLEVENSEITYQESEGLTTLPSPDESSKVLNSTMYKSKVYSDIAKPFGDHWLHYKTWLEKKGILKLLYRGPHLRPIMSIPVDVPRPSEHKEQNIVEPVMNSLNTEAPFVDNTPTVTATGSTAEERVEYLHQRWLAWQQSLASKMVHKLNKMLKYYENPEGNITESTVKVTDMIKQRDYWREIHRWSSRKSFSLYNKIPPQTHTSPSNLLEPQPQRFRPQWSNQSQAVDFSFHQDTKSTEPLEYIKYGRWSSPDSEVLNSQPRIATKESLTEGPRNVVGANESLTADPRNVVGAKESLTADPKNVVGAKVDIKRPKFPGHMSMVDHAESDKYFTKSMFPDQITNREFPSHSTVMGRSKRSRKQTFPEERLTANELNQDRFYKEISDLLGQTVQIETSAKETKSKAVKRLDRKRKAKYIQEKNEKSNEKNYGDFLITMDRYSDASDDEVKDESD